MVETHEYKGLWWLPNAESQQLPGTLTVTKGEGALELIGHFGHELISEPGTPEVYSLSLAGQPRILGMSTNGKNITLEDHILANNQESFPGIPTSTYRQSVTLIGKHFAGGERISFDEISIRASDLNIWTCVSGFNAKTGLTKHEKGYLMVNKVDVSFEAPDDIEIPLSRGERAFIRFSASAEGLTSGMDHVALRQEASLHVRFARRATLERVFTSVGQIRYLLSLAVGRPVAILAVTGYQDDFVRDGSGAHLPIQVLWGIPHNPDPPGRELHPSEMLFTLPEATPDLSRVMRSWLAKQERLRPVFNLFFGTRFHPDLFLDVRFLMHAQAIETYDYRRGRRPGNRTFAERVGAVLDQSKTVSKRIVGPTPNDRQEFIESVKVARNYYTHYNPKLEKKVARGAALVLLLVQLQAILEMALLRELGFPARTIIHVLQRTRRFEEIEHFRRIAT